MIGLELHVLSLIELIKVLFYFIRIVTYLPMLFKCMHNGLDNDQKANTILAHSLEVLMGFQPLSHCLGVLGVHKAE